MKTQYSAMKMITWIREHKKEWGYLCGELGTATREEVAHTMRELLREQHYEFLLMFMVTLYRDFLVGESLDRAVDEWVLHTWDESTLAFLAERTADWLENNPYIG